MIWVLPLQGHEPVRGGHERGVVIPAEPGAAFVVIEPEFAFELFVVELDLPPQPGEAGELLGLGVGGEVGDPVVDRLLLPFGPFGDQPFLAGRDGVAFSQSFPARTRRKQNRDVIGSPSGPSRNVTVWNCPPSSPAISSPIASGLRSGRGRVFCRP